MTDIDGTIYTLSAAERDEIMQTRNEDSMTVGGVSYGTFPANLPTITSDPATSRPPGHYGQAEVELQDTLSRLRNKLAGLEAENQRLSEENRILAAEASVLRADLRDTMAELQRHVVRLKAIEKSWGFMGGLNVIVTDTTACVD